MLPVSMTVNGEPISAEIEARLLLVQFLREELGLTGTHIGCETSYCGACTVLWDGAPVKSCTALAAQAAGADIVTIEGIADGDELHPVQRGFHERHGLQCGFCTPGMIIASVALLDQNPSPSEEEIRHWLDGNLCRCTGYQNIVSSVQFAAATIRGDTPLPAEWEAGESAVS